MQTTTLLQESVQEMTTKTEFNTATNLQFPGPSQGERLVIGGISGCIGTSFTLPMDVMKTRFQARQASKFTKQSIWTCAKHMYNTEGGLRPFFKGFQPSLIGILPHRAIYFWSYHQYKDWRGKDSCFTNLSAGIFANLAANISTSPLWMIKARCQLDKQRSSFAYHCKNIWRQRGLRGFYCGFFATCAGNIRLENCI